jgi:hypothetical protein
MVQLPDALIARLPLPQAHALRRALGVIAEELPGVYADNVRDQRPRDNANIFGLRVYFHLWTVLDERRDDLGDARIVMIDNARYLAVAGFKVAIHKLGHCLGDDIHSCYPEGSPTQRSYAQRNATQLSLFDVAPEAPLPEDRAYALGDLVVGHFGNPIDGLVKWYVGAPTYDVTGHPCWAWLARQPRAANEPVPEVIPYHQRQPAALEVKPRRHTEAEGSSDTGRGA